MKKETLEEAAERITMNNFSPATNKFTKINIFKEGAKWQQEQYSTEEKHIGHTINEFDKTYIKGFNDGSKWQQERSYSEEEVLELLREITVHCKTETMFNYINTKKWFEQFKNK